MSRAEGVGRFMAVYRLELERTMQERPIEYGVAGHGPETISELARRTAANMERGFMSGSYNHDGLAIRRTCKKLGVKATRRGMEEFFNGK
jgi:hypothetical protein